MNLIGLSRAELQAELEKLGEKPFRAKQLWHWIYWQGKTDFAEMTSLGKPLREKLAADGYTLNRPEIIREQNAADRTRKWLFKFEDGQSVETVYIPEEDRWITLKVCAKALKTIDKKGIYNVLLEVEKKGYIK